MTKIFFLTILVAAMLFSAANSYAAKICLVDNFGSYWELKGGKIDKKTWTTKKILSGICVIGGYADIVTTETGSLAISFYDNHDTAGDSCQVVFWSATANPRFQGSGSFDMLGDGSIEGGFDIDPVSCSELPPSSALLPVEANHPNIRRN